jgi:hypothetical protein
MSDLKNEVQARGENFATSFLLSFSGHGQSLNGKLNAVFPTPLTKAEYQDLASDLAKKYWNEGLIERL